MNRRAFLKRFGIGVSAALALASLPETAIRGLSVADAGQRCAIEYLRKVYNDYMRGRSACAYPRRIEVGEELFAAYEGEITFFERFCAVGEESLSVRNLKFKAATVYPSGSGWVARVVA
jgi:hypothetical protein